MTEQWDEIPQGGRSSQKKLIFILLAKPFLVQYLHKFSIAIC